MAIEMEQRQLSPNEEMEVDRRLAVLKEFTKIIVEYDVSYSSPRWVVAACMVFVCQQLEARASSGRAGPRFCAFCCWRSRPRSWSSRPTPACTGCGLRVAGAGCLGVFQGEGLYRERRGGLILRIYSLSERDLGQVARDFTSSLLCTHLYVASSYTNTKV
jgi:hypothetical protein